MQIVRGCDTKRNVLVYLIDSNKIIKGRPNKLDLNRPSYAMG